jgi:hypothetical protein
VKYVDKVDPEFVREKKGETVSGCGILNSQEAPQCLPPKAVATNSEHPSEAKRLRRQAPLKCPSFD